MRDRQRITQILSDLIFSTILATVILVKLIKCY